MTTREMILKLRKAIRMLERGPVLTGEWSQIAADARDVDRAAYRRALDAHTALTTKCECGNLKRNCGID